MQDRLKLALDTRFDDLEEVKDVANHGCSGGVSGFIYYYETSKFFDDYEDEIEEILFDLGIGHNTKEDETIRQLKNNAVWAVVEYYCFMRLEDFATMEVA